MVLSFMIFFSVLFMFSLWGLMNPNMIFGSIVPEQEKLGSNATGINKTYTDCEGYQRYAENQGISKEEADTNTEAVDARMEELQTDIIRNPWSEAQQIKIDEKECLKEIRIAETIADGTFPEGLKPSSEVENSTETKTYLPYSNQQLGISFEYPSDWNVQEKTNRFSDAPADVEAYSGLNSFKYQQDRTDVGESDLIDLELMADMAQNSLTSTPGTSLVESVDINKYRIDEKDTATFLIKTEGSFEENSNLNIDYATQVFVIDNDNRFDVIMYQNIVADFDTSESQEKLNHIIDSFRFTNSDQNDNSNDENDGDEEDN